MTRGSGDSGVGGDSELSDSQGNYRQGELRTREAGLACQMPHIVMAHLRSLLGLLRDGVGDVRSLVGLSVAICACLFTAPFVLSWVNLKASDPAS